MGLTEGDEVSSSRIDYGKQQAGVSVTLDQNGFDQQKFATAMSGGSAPTGALIDRSLIATYAQKGLIQPLDACISADGIDISQFYPAAVADVTYNGHVYGIPNDYSFRAVLLNNRVLTAAGLKASDIDFGNWDQLLAQAKKMYKSSGGKPTVLGIDPKIDSDGYLDMWAMADGGSIISTDGKPSLDDSKVVEALTYAVSLINAQGGWANFKSFRDTWDFFGKDNEFVKDQVGGFPMEQWYPNVLAGFASSVDVSAVPFKDRQGKTLSFESGTALVVPKGSENEGGMCAFAKAYSSVDAWDKAGVARDAANKKSGALFTGLFSANKSATDKLKATYLKPTGNAKFDQVISTYYASLDTATNIPGSPAGADILTAYQNAVTNALNGKDPKSELAAAQKTAMDAYNDAMG